MALKSYQRLHQRASGSKVATMCEEDDKMGKFEPDEVNMKISAFYIDLMLITQELQDPAPDISSELQTKDCSTSLQPPFMQIFSPSRDYVGYPFLSAPANPSMYGINVS